MNENFYSIQRVDVSRSTIKSIYTLTEDNASSFFGSSILIDFDKVFEIVEDTVEVDDIITINFPLVSDLARHRETGILTYRFIFHGADSTFGVDLRDALAYVYVLIDANTGEAYAVETRSLN